jgi:HK97 family phage major capsid protein
MDPQLKQLEELLAQTLKTSSETGSAVQEIRSEFDNIKKRSEEQKDDFDVIRKQLGELDVFVKESKRKTGVDVKGLTREDAKDFKFWKVFMALTLKKNGASDKEAWTAVDGEFERELVHETRKAMVASGDPFLKAGHQVSVDASGGLFVPAQVADDFIEALREKLVLEQELGARVMSGLRGSSVWIPEQKSKTSVAWLNENGVPTESDIDFGQIKLEPRYAAAFVTISNKLIENSPTQIESLVREDMVEQMARHLQIGALNGGGGQEPRGLLQIPGIQTLSLNAGAGRNFNFDDAEIMRNIIEENDVPGEVAFLSRPTVWSLMKRLKVDHYSGQAAVGNQSYLLGRPPMSNASLAEALGSAFSKTTSLPKTNATNGAIVTTGGTGSPVVAGIWRDLILAFWSRLRVRVSTQASLNGRSAFLQDETWLVVESAFDSNVRRKESFVKAMDATLI